MEEIKVGEYIRTDEGYISKETNKNFIRMLLAGKSSFGKLKKHSKNIIDLIEVRRYYRNIFSNQTKNKKNICR